MPEALKRTMAAGAAGLVVGLVSGAAVWMGDPDVVSHSDPGWSGTIRSAALLWNPPPCEAVERETDRLRAEIALAMQTMKDVRVRAEGVPIPWSAVRGEQFLPDAFEQVIEEAKANCPHLDVVHIDCEEPPCFVWVQPERTSLWDVKQRAEADTEVLRCAPSWIRQYSGYEGGSFDVDCDGTPVHGVIYGTGGWTFEKGDPDFEANVKKRSRMRLGAAQESWPCPDAL